mmetsp:Transcript_22979/g.50077  ORF Transcript_22979/g.50077 Transcript_22979/m.50077 type:complete len:119 (+) Transcript_22979:2405-2761(+)
MHNYATFGHDEINTRRELEHFLESNSQVIVGPKPTIQIGNKIKRKQTPAYAGINLPRFARHTAKHPNAQRPFRDPNHLTSILERQIVTNESHQVLKKRTSKGKITIVQVRRGQNCPSY